MFYIGSDYVIIFIPDWQFLDKVQAASTLFTHCLCTVSDILTAWIAFLKVTSPGHPLNQQSYLGIQVQQQYRISEVLRVQWLSLCGSSRHPVVTSGQLSNEPQFENKLLLQHQIPACTSICFSSPNVVIELGSCWTSLR